MCGFAGRVSGGGTIDVAEVRAMGAALAHRGPDGEGLLVRPRAVLAHRRLAIVDLAGGVQPMPNEDQSVWVAYNGEVYNHVDLRRALEARGHRFRTRCDTEAIVHAYEEAGADCAASLQGMFAFAIWDEPARRLLLVRDRLGVKPLYYATVGEDLLFASELKALLASRDVDRTLDDEAIDAYLGLRYVPAPRTGLRGVRKLGPGQLLVWERGRTAVRSWWDLPLGAPSPPAATEAEAAAELREALDRSIGLGLMGDVPVGAFLSGGLDSTFVAASVTAHPRPTPLRTFAVGYRGAGAGASELGWAAQAARALGTEHHELWLRDVDVRDALPQVAWHLDEPVGDPSAAPLLLLSRRAREEVTVVLSGEGADELLAGYAIYPRTLRLAAARQALGPLAAAGGAALRRAPWPRLRRLGEALARDPIAAYRGVSRALDAAARARLGAPDDARALERALAPLRDAAAGEPALRRLLYVDLKAWLPDDVLLKADRMTMAAGLELRVPLLDHLVAERCYLLPDERKLAAGVGKALLRRAARGRVPSPILSRVKRGFSVPVDAWLRGAVHEVARAALLDARSPCRGRFEPRALAAALDGHRRGRPSIDAGALWALMALGLWSRAIAGAPPPCRPSRGG